MKITSKLFFPPFQAIKLITIELSERDAQLLSGIVGVVSCQNAVAMFNNSIIKSELKLTTATNAEMTNLTNNLYNRLLDVCR